jgi:ABC-type transport system involved in multi-copper enzyme maturation permease subunit
VGEREDRTLGYLVANGVSRARLLLGKFCGAALTLGISLLLGFCVAGAAIGYKAQDRNIGSFVTLALSAAVLGLIFLAGGLAISTFSRTRVQALVLCLLTWGMAVFAFDLAALGLLVTVASPAAQSEIDLACDPAHVNAEAANIHAAFDAPAEAPRQAAVGRPASHASWLWINPVDLFRAVNLQRQLQTPVPAAMIAICAGGWIVFALLLSERKLRRMDL